MNNKKIKNNYWEKNIDKWGKFYSGTSHSEEEFERPKWLNFLYKLFINPIEARLMKKRYEITIDFINHQVTEGMTVVDLGCGTGIFTVEMLKCGATVIALDNSKQALKLTKSLVQKTMPELAKNVEYNLLDVNESTLPKSDLVLSMGVTPYITDIETFFKHILPTTKQLYNLVLDEEHWANVVRRILPILNIRDMNSFSRSRIEAIYSKYQWEITTRENFASGFLDHIRRKEQIE